MNHLLDFIWFLCVTGCGLAFMVMLAAWVMQGRLDQGDDGE